MMVDLSFLGDLGRGLEAALEEGRLHQTAADAALASAAWGEDPAGAVRAAVNVHGGFVTATLAPAWRSMVDTEELGTAVVAAVGSAEAARAAGQLQPLPRDLLPHRSATPPPPRSASTRSPEEAMQWLSELLRDVHSSLADLQTVASRAAADEVVGNSSCGRVVATARAGALVTVDCDPSWLGSAQREAVHVALAEALTEALPGTARRVTAAVRQTGRVGELLDIAADTAGLLASLGLAGRAEKGARDAA
jgi:hypothetical protein